MPYSKEKSPEICFVSDALRAPYDEGMKIIARELARFLVEKHNACIVAPPDHGLPKKRWKIYERRFGRSLICGEVLGTIRKLKPNIIVYMPWAALTSYSILRAFLLRSAHKLGRLVLVGVQPRPLDRIGKWTAKALRPSAVVVQEEKSRKQWSTIGIRTIMIRSGVDLEKFRPALETERQEIRKKLGFIDEDYIVLHVGHLVASRNLWILEEIARTGQARVVVVGSETIAAEAHVVSGLRAAGVWVVDKFVNSIEEFYRATDVYVFPVEDTEGAVGMPLSVLEARACGVPVVSTNFGALRDKKSVFWDDPGLLVVNHAHEIVHFVSERKESLRALRRDGLTIREYYGWEGALESLKECLQ